MSQIFEFLFGQYETYPSHQVWLEIIAVIFGGLSVLFSKQNNILVYPTGILSTLIFVYLCYQWGLLGDMMINGYYFAMSIYGWYIWTRKVDATHVTPVTSTTVPERRYAAFIFLGTLFFVFVVYTVFDRWTSWVAYVDTLTTAIFFVGMWLMARRKIENWIFWILGDLISVPLYFYKGYTFTSLQYAIFTVIAIYGYLSWKKYLDKPLAIA